MSDINDYAHDAWLERIADNVVGYCKECGGMVFRKELRGRRTWDEGQSEPDEAVLNCPTCGEVTDEDVSEEVE